MTEPRTITLRSYAKINLSLQITGRRPDGYHNIVSLMQGIDLFDVIKITKCPQNGTKYNLPHCIIGPVVVYLCTDARTIPTDMSNLAFRGIKAVLDELEGRGLLQDICSGPDGLRELVVDIDKRLPVAAGIAGGSGNAAVCMLGLNSLLGDPLDMEQLSKAGVKVGADVPFSLVMNAYQNAATLRNSGNGGPAGLDETSPAAWVRGIGDIVRPAEPLVRHIIMANPGIPVSTKAAYEAIDAIQEAADKQGRREEQTEELLFVNDLESYTLAGHEEAARLKSLMQRELGADAVLMSGSGPTIIAYYEDADRAEAGFARMKRIMEEMPESTGTDPDSAENRWKVWKTCTGMTHPEQ